jgi:hypothetical protein
MATNVGIISFDIKDAYELEGLTTEMLFEGDFTSIAISPCGNLLSAGGKEVLVYLDLRRGKDGMCFSLSKASGVADRDIREMWITDDFLIFKSFKAH